MHTLIMPLVGPMQSWGHRSRFDDRDTGLEPTRSGIIGLVCAAMGIPRNGDLSRFDDLRMGVRVDVPGRVMVDYQTARDVAKADGSGVGTVTSQRHYLSDARFLVGVESNDLGLLEEMDWALRHPAWFLFLGRKSFVPSIPPCLPDSSVKLDTTLEDALQGHPFVKLSTWEPMPAEPLRMIIEVAGADRDALVRNDVPLDFEERRFGLRRVVTKWLDNSEIEDGGVWPCASTSRS